MQYYVTLNHNGASIYQDRVNIHRRNFVFEWVSKTGSYLSVFDNHIRAVIFFQGV